MSGERILPGIGLTGFWDAGSNGWKPGTDVNWLDLSALVQSAVKSRVTALPGSPTNGDIYIVPSPDNRIAVRDNGAWSYLTPKEGWQTWVADEDAMYAFTGSAWVKGAGQPVDHCGYVVAVGGGSSVLWKIVFTRAVTFPSGFAGSQAHAGVAATASTVLTIKKNGTSVGSLTFGAAGVVGAFATSGGAVTVAAGDYLEVFAPASADATLAAVAITLAGMR